ncbi:MAG: hypothetical protein CVU08_07500 [Bacteroidetes bacterium HGW-Bacteroidetes-3]|nr:MAG: hypothetical protein CVU08_07500 [Bacteroidetes bacterium HGW-Bacteroidetes-3]
MIKLFRNIRKKLVEQGKTANYLKYAIGEIVLVVIGILIALQINNWNEKNKAKKEFEFGLKQVYSQIPAGHYDLSTTEERLGIQLSYIDSILNYPDSLDPEMIPGVIQLLDYSGISATNNFQELLQPYLKLNPNDEAQNELAKSLRRFLTSNNTNSTFNFDSTNAPYLFYEYVKKYNIPLRFLGAAVSSKEFVKPPSNNFYSQENKDSAKQLINDPAFIADVKSIQLIKKNFLKSIPDYLNNGELTLAFLGKNYPNSIIKIQKMELIGTGIPNGNWAFGFPMKLIDDGVFELQTQLVDGEIKFRTDSDWTFDWGRSQNHVEKLVFKGSNIPVKKGLYKITLNILSNKYKIKKVDDKTL